MLARSTDAHAPRGRVSQVDELRAQLQEAGARHDAAQHEAMQEAAAEHRALLRTEQEQRASLQTVSPTATRHTQEPRSSGQTDGTVLCARAF
jgi:protein subunit release factor B